MVEQNELSRSSSKIPAYIFDLDGVLADNSHRQGILEGKPTSKDWNLFFSLSGGDSVYSDTRKLLLTLQAAGYQILIVTGRSEDYEEMTEEWLKNFGMIPNRLYQRRHKDFRKDFEIKEEIYRTQIQPFYDVLGVFEDRKDCVEMWRKRGLTCYQPREAEY